MGAPWLQAVAAPDAISTTPNTPPRTALSKSLPVRKAHWDDPNRPCHREIGQTRFHVIRIELPHGLRQAMRNDESMVNG
jgi:hypothetical protein